MTKKDKKPDPTNMDRDEGSSVVVEERQHLKELRERSSKKDSCIQFYCKECRGLTAVTKHPKKYVFKCNFCEAKQVAFGTEASIHKFFHLKDDEPMLTEEDYKKRMIMEEEEMKRRDARRKERAARTAK
ncbi:hypothetical protein HOG48_06105 [Candidatus Peregrinibacteria bacterium]|jgi:hypothetical protein|nr:hypothetical protein [Candidatus Peregrinibacteria bacterium]